MKKLIAMLLSLVMLFCTPLVASASDVAKGFDISVHNGDVNFSSQAKSNSFVMIRIGNYNYLDVKFWDNVKGACDAGLDFGVYMYSAAFNKDEALIEANFVLDTLSQMPKEYLSHFKLPVAYDIEAKGLMDFSVKQLTDNVVTFSEKMIKSGYVPMVYANTDWFTNRLDINTFKSKGYKIWLADWVSKPDFTKKRQVGTTGVYADMWQYSDNVKGFDANAILNTGIYHYYRDSVKPATTSANGKIESKCIACGKVKSTTTIAYAKSLSLSKTKLTYNAKVQHPSVTIKDSNGDIISSKYYDVVYSKGCKSVGKYTAKVNFKGNYKGTLSKTFVINPKNTTLRLEAKKQGFKASWSKQPFSYELRYSTSSKMSNPKSVNIKDSSTLSKSISKLNSNKTYYVQIRTYKTVNSVTYYSSWSSKKSIKTK